MSIDNGYYNKDYRLLGKYLLITVLILLVMTYYIITSGWFSMKTEANRRVNSRTQSTVQNDFPQLSHLSPLLLVSQSDKHHKEPMFLH